MDQRTWPRVRVARCWGGVFPPSSPRAWEKLLAPLAETQPRARGRLTGGTGSTLGPVSEYWNPGKCPQHSSSHFGQPLGSHSSSLHRPRSSWCQRGTAWGLGGGREGCFLGSWGSSGGWHPRTGPTKNGVLPEPAGKVTHPRTPHLHPPWPPFGPKLCHFQVTSKPTRHKQQ